MANRGEVWCNKKANAKMKGTQKKKCVRVDATRLTCNESKSGSRFHFILYDFFLLRAATTFWCNHVTGTSRKYIATYFAVHSICPTNFNQLDECAVSTLESLSLALSLSLSQAWYSFIPFAVFSQFCFSLLLQNLLGNANAPPFFSHSPNAPKT